MNGKIIIHANNRADLWGLERYIREKIQALRVRHKIRFDDRENIITITLRPIK